MPADDAQMTSAVRKIIISNRFDVAQVRIRVTRGVINLQGRVEKAAGERANVQQLEASLRRMDDEFHALKGFRGAAYLFDNWVREGSGGWRFSGSRRELEQLGGR